MRHNEDLEHKTPKPEVKECHCEQDKCHCGCGENKCDCGCGCGCCCKGKKFFAKLLAALILFLAGFGFAHLFCCCCHHGKPMPQPQVQAHGMMKHKARPDFADGANNIIIINSDGKAEVAHRPAKMHHKNKKHRYIPMPADTLSAETEAAPAKNSVAE